MAEFHFGSECKTQAVVILDTNALNSIVIDFVEIELDGGDYEKREKNESEQKISIRGR